jgi:hypothetical protein
LIFTAHYLHAEKVKGVIRVQIIEEKVTAEKHSHKFWENSHVYNLKASQRSDQSEEGNSSQRSDQSEEGNSM